MKNTLSTFIDNSWDEFDHKIYSNLKNLTREDIDEIANTPEQLIEKLITF